MQILMTGASGFIGQAWLKVYGGRYDIFSLGRNKSFEGDRFTHIDCDLSNPLSLQQCFESQKLPEKINAFLHLGVSRLHRNFPETALDMFEINVGSFARLMDYVHRVGASQVVLGSTGSVYDGFDEDYITEDRALSPAKYFPASKLAAELLARQYSHSLKLSILRFFTPYGPGQDGRLIQDIAQRIRMQKPVTLPSQGGGMAVCGIFIDDVTQIIETALKDKWQGTLNVAGNDCYDIETLALCLGKILETDVIFKRNSEGPSKRVTPCLKALGEHIDLAGLTSFDEGLRRCFQVSTS